MTMPAPARAIAVSDSRMAPRLSIQPRCAAASIIAASPLTWYAASGRSKRCRARARRSREVIAGLTIRMAAPPAAGLRRAAAAAAPAPGLADRRRQSRCDLLIPESRTAAPRRYRALRNDGLHAEQGRASAGDVPPARESRAAFRVR